jgi:hypothetical protein
MLPSGLLVSGFVPGSGLAPWDDARDGWDGKEGLLTGWRRQSKATLLYSHMKGKHKRRLGFGCTWKDGWCQLGQKVEPWMGQIRAAQWG